MPQETYRMLHQIGIVILLLGLGCVLATPRDRGRGLAMLLHGVGLLLVLVAGFGLQAKRNVGFPMWLWAKIGIFVLLALLPTLVKRGVLGTGMAIVLAALLASSAIYLVTYRPF